MKNGVLAVIPWFVCSLAFAAGPELPQRQGAPQQQGLVGTGWVISATSSKTAIAKSNITTKRWFTISNANLLDSPNVVTLQVDNNALPFPLHPGASALVYGAQVSPSHSMAKSGSVGNWAIVPITQISTTSVIWMVSPSKSPLATIAMFDIEREFVVEIAKEDPPPDKTCRKGEITVLVDGKPVAIEGNALDQAQETYGQGSAVIGKGKHVAVRAVGECEGHAVFYGTLKFLDFVSQ